MKPPAHPRVAERTVRALCPATPREVAAIGQDATVVEALTVMAAHDCDAVPVLDGTRVVGVFSAGDLARTSLRDGGAATAMTVRHAMSRCEIVAAPTQTLQDCLDQMTKARLRHVPVIDGDTLVGMVVLDALLREIVAHHARVFQELELDWSILFLRGTYSC